MTEPVSFEIKELLFNKGWRYELGSDETGRKMTNSLAEQRWNEGDLSYVDITIAKVIMWLYKKYGIWIEVRFLESFKTFYFELININNLKGMTSKGENHFDSPTEAYETAIRYALNNLI